jgi:CO dehydrogenase/acetyl-CoA synthase delta subunit
MTYGIHTFNIPSHVLNKAARYELDTVIDEECKWFMRK